MKKVKKIKKIFIKGIFLSSFLLSVLIVLIKLSIPIQYQVLEAVSIYWSILSSVIFLYWFILSPVISEYKESEKLLTDIKNSLINIKDDIEYFKRLKPEFEIKSKEFSKILNTNIDNFYDYIVDGKVWFNIDSLNELNRIALEWEKLWITANHIIRLKQELSIVKKSFLRIWEIKEKFSIPKIIHQLKNFITFMVIVTLLFINIWKEWIDMVWQIQESVMLFLISFLYIFLSFIINGLENPFDKGRFVWYLDLNFLKEYTKENV
jgi:hypothetical protein